MLKVEVIAKMYNKTYMKKKKKTYMEKRASENFDETIF